MRKANYRLIKSDKGSNFIFLPDYFYNNMVLQHLNDQSTYEENNKPLEDKIHENIVLLMNRHKLELTQQEFSTLIKKDFISSKFHILPKLHKCKQIPNFLKENESYV